jgi:hypothetical protein
VQGLRNWVSSPELARSVAPEWSRQAPAAALRSRHAPTAQSTRRQSEEAWLERRAGGPRTHRRESPPNLQVRTIAPPPPPPPPLGAPLAGMGSQRHHSSPPYSSLGLHSPRQRPPQPAVHIRTQDLRSQEELVEQLQVTAKGYIMYTYTIRNNISLCWQRKRDALLRREADEQAVAQHLQPVQQVHHLLSAGTAVEGTAPRRTAAPELYVHR